MPTKCCWVIHGSLTSERKASTSPSSFINHSILLLNRALKRQAPCFYMHFEVRALDRLRTRRRVGSTRRRGDHKHDHSRFQRDINDVTGVSLSLSLSQMSLTHNIGSASALPIILHDSRLANRFYRKTPFRNVSECLKTQLQVDPRNSFLQPLFTFHMTGRSPGSMRKLAGPS